jgi:hypothetical protein
MFYKIEFWVKDEMNEKNLIGMPKFFIPFQGVLTENGVLNLIRRLDNQATHL